MDIFQFDRNEVSLPEELTYEYVNSVYSQGVFLRAMSFLVNGVGYTVNDDFCCFREDVLFERTLNENEVLIGIGSHEAIVSKGYLFKTIIAACDIYTKRHLKDLAKIDEILKNMDTSGRE